MEHLCVATLATDGAGDVDQNFSVIEQALTWAVDAGAQVLATNECALTGYPPLSAVSQQHSMPPQLNRQAHRARQARAALLQQAHDTGIGLILGTATPNSEISEAGWWNEIHWSDDQGTGSYQKRYLMPNEIACQGLAASQPAAQADQPLMTVAGWKLGLHICYEVRFAPLIARTAREADALVAVAHMANPDPDGIKAEIIPAHYATRAAEWACPLVLANTCASNAVLPSGAWTASGSSAPGQSETFEQAGRSFERHLHVLRHRDQYDPWLRYVRKDQLRSW
jgi:predicted amidohydrolase